VALREDVEPPFKVVWRFQRQKQADKSLANQLNSSLVTADNLYFMGFWSFGAVDIATGKRLWEKPLHNVYSQNHITGDNKTLYVSSKDGHVRALEARSGKNLWEIAGKSNFRHLLFWENTLFCQLSDGVLTALDTRTRKPRWSLNLKYNSSGKERTKTWNINRAPLVFGDKLIISGSVHELLCVESAGGKVLWHIRVGSTEKDFVREIVGDENSIYCIRTYGKIERIDLKTGRRQWQFSIKPAMNHHAPALNGSSLYVTSQDAQLYAIDALTGKQRWVQRLSNRLHPQISPMIVADDRVLVTCGSTLFCFSTEGKLLWEWDTKEDLAGNMLHSIPAGLLLSGWEDFFVLAPGQPSLPTTSKAARLAMAKRLVARLDRLGLQERGRLTALGDEAFEALFDTARRGLATNINRTADAVGHKTGPRPPFAWFYFSLAMNEVMQPQHSGQLMTLLHLAHKRKDEGAQQTLIKLLAEHGDRRALPLFLSILNRKSPNTKKSYFYEALAYISKSTEREAVDFLITHLKDEKSNPDIRLAAYRNLARTGGEKGREAVLLARSRLRNARPVAEYLKLDKVGPEPEKSYAAGAAVLMATRKDKTGIRWGVVTHDILGSRGDLWLVRHNGKRWTQPLFTGETLGTYGSFADTSQRPKTDWLKVWFERFVTNTNLRIDSDGDGWTNKIEARLSTNPYKADSDDDGLADGEDMNPLAAPRPLREAEQILYAAYEAIFWGRESEVARLLKLPVGIERFEVPSWGWIVIPEEAGNKTPLGGLPGEGVSIVSYSRSTGDMTGISIGQEDEVGIIRLNPDHTEAQIMVSSYSGGDNISLKKFGSHWFVVGVNWAFRS
jgi:outer membrane protein assembly factor BamB